MKSRFKLLTGAAIGLVALGIACTKCDKGSDGLLPPKRPPIATTQDPSNYSLIETREKRFIDDYFVEFRKLNCGLEGAIKKHGYGKMHGVYAKLYLEALGHARDKIDGKATEEDDGRVYRGIADEFTTGMKDHDTLGAVNYKKKGVVDAYISWARINSDFSGKLLAQKSPEDYGTMIRRAYTEKEFADFIEKQDKGIDVIYDAFSEARQGFLGALAGIPLKQGRELTKKFYRETRMKDYRK